MNARREVRSVGIGLPHLAHGIGAAPALPPSRWATGVIAPQCAHSLVGSSNHHSSNSQGRPARPVAREMI